MEDEYVPPDRLERVDIIIDGQKPLDMWTREELEVKRHELITDMNEHSHQINVLSKQIAELTPWLDQAMGKVVYPKVQSMAKVPDEPTN